MFARLIPIRTQHGVRSEIVLLAYGRWDQPVGETVWIDELTRQTARGFISQTAGTAGNYVAKSCSLVGEMEKKFEIYLKAIWAAKKPDEKKMGLLY